MNSQGSHAGIIQGGDVSRFSILLKRKDKIDNRDRAEIKVDPPTNCLKAGGIHNFRGDELIGGCQRSPYQETSITVNFKKSDAQQLYIPALIPAAPVSATDPKIIGVAVLADCCDGPCRPVNEKTWITTFPIRDVNHIGAGYLVEPEPFSRLTNHDFGMYDHHYITAGVPDPNRATITYRFDKPAKIAEVLLVQHQNGILVIEGMIGDDENQLRTMGLANSSLGGDLPLASSRFTEGQRDIFKFAEPAEGKVFKIVIKRTSLSNGWALYRAYPRNERHKAFDVLRDEDSVAATQ